MASVSASDDVNQAIQTENLDLVSADASEDILTVSLDNAADDTQSTSLSNDVLGVSGGDEILSGNQTWYVNSSKSASGDGKSDETAFKTLNEALNAAEDDNTIMIASGTYDVEGDNVALEIDKNNLNLIKYGDGEAIFDGNQHFRIFNVTATTINIDGLTFKNGRDKGNGAAIYFKNTLVNSNINATFINGLADGDGGAIYFENGADNISLSGTFIHNKASNGGAICFQNAVNNITIAADFINNSAAIDGGANSFYSVTNLKLTGNYMGNVALDDGGANYFHVNVTDLYLRGYFENNTAEEGGATYFNNTLTNARILGYFYNNNATLNGAANNFNMVNNVSLIGYFVDNSVSRNGGANYFYGEVNGLNISGIYVNNVAERNGGANYFRQPVTNLNIYGNFTNNKAGRYGGANRFYNDLTYSSISGGFFNNSAGTDGGANDFLTVRNVTVSGDFVGNHAGFDGGANSFDAVTNLFLSGYFGGNIADDDGGANYFHVNVTDFILFGYFENNVAEEGGANYFNNTLSNSDVVADFVNNSAVRGGANNFNIVNNVNLGGLYANNSVSRNGGVNYFYGEVNKLNMSGSYVNNVALRNGGVNYFNNAVTYLNLYGNFTNNRAGITAGVNRFYSDLRFSSISGSFVNNSAGTDGGANDFLTVRNVTVSGDFVGNHAGFDGGANSFDAVTNLFLSGYFDGNIADDDGGANYFHVNVTDFVLFGFFENNVAEEGGANYFNNTLANADIVAGFVNNTATINGGANNFNIVNDAYLSGAYTNNTAGKNGGANYFYGEVNNLYLSGIYIGNVAGRSAGANYFRDGVTNLNLTGEYYDNKASNSAANRFYRNLSNADISGKYINNSGNSVIHIGNNINNNIIHDAIFINNNNDLISVDNGDDIQTVDSWFGNNATNYNVKPDAGNVTLDNWLFLNATANPDKIKQNESSVIVFELYSYNETSDNVDDYNASKMNVTLDLSATSGLLNQSNALLGEEVLYTSSNNGNAGVTGKFETAYYTIDVNVASSVIIIDDLTKYYHGPEKLVLNLTDNQGNPIANATVTIDINGVPYNRTTDEKGQASMAINLNSGEYSVVATYNDTSANAKITVLSTVNGTDVVKVFRNGTQYYATFRNSNGEYLADGTTVKFNINGVFYERNITGNEGLAKLNINLEQGEYIITAMNPVTGENTANNVTVIPRIIENNDFTKYYRNASQYTVKVLGSNGNPVGANVTVKFNINGVFYERQTNESGIAKLNINLQPGEYIITAEYGGCRVSNNITVLPVLSAEDITMKYLDGTQFVANLVDGEGKPYAGENVTFNVNGVFYDRVTDGSGQAKLNINLMAGEYIITSSYNEANIANTITISEDSQADGNHDGSEEKLDPADDPVMKNKGDVYSRLQLTPENMIYI